MPFITPSGDFVTWSSPEWWGDIFPLPTSLVHCQRKQLAVQSTVWLGDSLHAAVVIRGVGNSTVLWVLEPRSLYRGSPYALTIVLTERVLIWEYSVVILIPGRQNVITVEWGEFAVVILRSRSPHLPFVWLFQHWSSSDSVSLPLAQMSSGRLDQNLLDSFNLSLMSITCHRPKQKYYILGLIVLYFTGWEVRVRSDSTPFVLYNTKVRTTVCSSQNMKLFPLPLVNLICNVLTFAYGKTK